MNRTCPRCNTPLTQELLHGESVDRCPTCNGIFFDAGELAHISRLTEILNRIVLDEEDIITPEKNRVPPLCPVDGAEMALHKIGDLEVDRCPTCSGYWLDGGELSTLHLIERHIRDNLNLYMRLGS